MSNATPSPSATAFRAARDHLLTHREQQAKLGASFRWPRLTQFNWALDHFDRLAREDGNAPALWIVNEGAGEQKISYAQMAARSNQVANWLRGLGVRRGDRVLLMLGNEVPLWETMLAAFKLGAVVIPASSLLTPCLAQRAGQLDARRAHPGASVPRGLTRSTR